MKSTPARAAPKARIGPRCCSGCTPAGPSRKGYKVEIVDYHGGDQAGIKSVTLLVKGENAYGYAKTESGVHRLVRISPYDSAAKRHTSFSSVWVYPVIDDDIDIEINESDLKIDTYRASGAGGQHVNTTDSAVRITHQPSGIVVASQNDRSQHKNRATAMNMLKARLFEKEMAEREAVASGEYQEKTEIGWGHQIRSYVLQPYQMVKDLRTGVTSPSPDDSAGRRDRRIHLRCAGAAGDRRHGRGRGRRMNAGGQASAGRLCCPCLDGTFRLRPICRRCRPPGNLARNFPAPIAPYPTWVRTSFLPRPSATAWAKRRRSWTLPKSNPA